MTSFELAEPGSLDEALHLLAAADPSVRPAGGCTALMLMMKAGVFKPTRLVSLRRLEARYAEIESTPEALAIGALATLSSIERSPLVAQALPSIKRTLRTLANVRVRNVATLGGNLAHADPHMDLPPLLVALGASAIVAGRSGRRTVALEDLISGYYETTLGGDELIVQVTIPTRLARTALYRKVTTRSADDWPTLGVAIALDRREGAVREARVVLSAAVDRPTRLASVEALLRGATADADLPRRAGEAAAAEAEPQADVRGSVAYKRQLIRIHVGRALGEALGIVQAVRP